MLNQVSLYVIQPKFDIQNVISQSAFFK